LLDPTSPTGHAGKRDHTETLDCDVELKLSAEDCYRHLRELAWNCIKLVASSVGLSESAATALLEGCTKQDLPCAQPEKRVPDAAVSLGGQSSSATTSTTTAIATTTKTATTDVAATAAAANGSSITATNTQPSLSASNLTGINYGVGDGCLTQNAHCPFHTDKCLVTIIPLARTGTGSSSNGQTGGGMQAGLRVFDWHAQCWMDVETNAPQPHFLDSAANRQFALVFGGESLARATNGFIQPAVHEVLQPQMGEMHDITVNGLETAAPGDGVQPFRRLSTPFQAFAPPDAVFDCGALDPKVVGEVAPRHASPVNAQVFLSQVSQGMLSCY
jgi:hypothetical protein